MSGFVHLHLHTEYSLLDGECRISEIAKAVKANGQTAVAVTDHGALYGAVDFFRACKEEKIKPIIGCEVYVAPRKMEDKVYPVDISPYHLVLLVQNETGWKNLTAIVSDSYLKGFYRKPRTDMQYLAGHSEGLIALSACMSGVLCKRIAEGNTSDARQIAAEFDRIFEGRFYIELQRNGVPEQNKINTVLCRIAEELGISVVATNDVHYIRKEDAEAQELLMAISTGGVMGGDFAMPSEEFYLKSTEEMRALFSDIPEAVSVTERIAEECNFEFDFSSHHLPRFDTPKGYTSEEYLKFLAGEGLEKRLSDAENAEREEYTKRLEYELSVINKMGFDDYFLVVRDFVYHARSRGIPVGPGRGSAVGSLTAFALGITDVDPIKYKLIFERFLNPERASMPDIDIDFSDTRRGEVIDYVAGKYGNDHMAQIITFDTLQSRAAIRDTGRALGMSYADVDSVAKKIPRGLDMTLAKALEISPELKQMYDTDPTAKRLIDLASKMEGRPRNASTHASGIVITDKPITDYMPLALNDEVAVTQFGMNTVAELGLLKMDFLGLRYLTVIRETEELIRRTEPDFNIEKVSIDDRQTYEMLSEGRTLGIFQLEKDGMRSLLSRVKPQNLEDIVAIISLYRPGPMQFIDTFLKNRKDIGGIEYKTPLLKPILDSTMGCMLYQEQVMQICRELAGFTYGHADLVRRAMAKKKKEAMKSERTAFVNGCEANGVDNATAEELFDSMESFASYAFNKSHAAAYAIVSYRTAYLKAHYPAEYITALLNSVSGDTEKTNLYISDSQSIGIAVHGPDVNRSGGNFTLVDGEICFGLSSIKNVGVGFAAGVEDERKDGGKFTSYEDFICRMGTSLNTKTLQSLVLAGACDTFGIERSKMAAVAEKALQSISGMKSELKAGQISLFDGIGGDYTPLKIDYPNINEYPVSERLALEKEYTGVYFSGHPLENYKKYAKKINTVTISDLYHGLKEGIIADKTTVNLVVSIVNCRKKATKTSKIMAFLTVEDISGTTEVIVFPTLLDKYSAILTEGEIVALTAEASLEEPYGGGDDILKLLLKSVVPAVSDGECLSGLDIYIKITPENRALLKKALKIAECKDGNGKIFVYDTESGKLSVSKNIFCNVTQKTVDEITELMGKGNVATKKQK